MTLMYLYQGINVSSPLDVVSHRLVDDECILHIVQIILYRILRDAALLHRPERVLYLVRIGKRPYATCNDINQFFQIMI